MAVRSRTSSALLVPLFALLLLITIGARGCQTRNGEELRALLQQHIDALDTVVIRALETHIFYPDPELDGGQEAQISRLVIRKGSLTLGIASYSHIEPISRWKSDSSTAFDPGTGEEIYADLWSFDVLDLDRLVENYRAQKLRENVDWDGRLGTEYALLPIGRFGPSFRLTIDCDTGIIVRALLLDESGRRERLSSLRDLAILDNVPVELATRLERQAQAEVRRNRAREESLLGPDDVRQIIPDFDLPEELPSGYGRREMRRFVDARSVHGVIGEYTDGVLRLSVVALPHHGMSSADILGVTAGFSDGGVTARESLPIFRQSVRQGGLTTFKSLSPPVDLMIVTHLPDANVGAVFEAIGR
jgi:hypothetical protein